MNHQEAKAYMLQVRGVKAYDACKTCGGMGKRCYGNTSTWRGGIGGQAMTTGVCNKCWGSGSTSVPGANLKKMEGEIKSLRAKVKRLERKLEK